MDNHSTLQKSHLKTASDPDINTVPGAEEEQGEQLTSSS